MASLWLICFGMPRTFLAHPNALDANRASCGAEFHTAANAFVIPDVKEAWSYRRIQTCDEPFLWLSFDIAQNNQQLYVAAIGPEIARFQDKWKFNAVIFGPGLPQLSESDLPEAIQGQVSSDLGGMRLESPASLASCNFVDENEVMRSYSDVINGRCMEEFTLDETYDNKLMAGRTWYSWWLFSKNLNMASKGTYYIACWLTDRDSNEVVSGKYDLTIAPWKWFSGPSEALVAEARKQVSSCICSQVGIEFSEQNLEVLGSVPEDILAEVLPYETCSQTASRSNCQSAEWVGKISPDSPVEYAAVWSLNAGMDCAWTFYAFGGPTLFEYPDPAIDVFLSPCNNMAEIELHADFTLKNETGALLREHDSELALELDSKQVLQFRDAEHTSFRLHVNETGRYCFFTQHLPAEFLAVFMTCSTSSANGSTLLFPHQSFMYKEGVERTSSSTFTSTLTSTLTSTFSSTMLSSSTLTSTFSSTLTTTDGVGPMQVQVSSSICLRTSFLLLTLALVWARDA